MKYKEAAESSEALIGGSIEERTTALQYVRDHEMWSAVRHWNATDTLLCTVHSPYKRDVVKRRVRHGMQRARRCPAEGDGRASVGTASYDDDGTRGSEAERAS
eukprot:IDg182t1